MHRSRGARRNGSIKWQLPRWPVDAFTRGHRGPAGGVTARIIVGSADAGASENIRTELDRQRLRSKPEAAGREAGGGIGAKRLKRGVCRRVDDNRGLRCRYYGGFMFNATACKRVATHGRNCSIVEAATITLPYESIC